MALFTKKNNFPIHEQLEIGFLLAMIGGFLDAYTFICFNGIFANAQTGNIVLLGIALIHQSADEVIAYLIPISFFAIGIFVTEFFATHLIKSFFIVTLIIELFMLTFIGFYPDLLPEFVTLAIISMACSIQLSSFKKISGISYSSTMCTGNLRAAMESLYGYFHKKDRTLLHRFWHYGAIIVFFGVGAVVGAIGSSYFGKSSIFICSALCLILTVIIAADSFVSQLKNKL